ncbi:hypothetical protein [Tsuneonella amylolytica]|uniref:hypothetical protein n=1 Tax=Tsuneonella amylolytica TaxID=2338327 RepID=UPI0013C51828|nr:hypothetical protein [Tsuneonella amylolytica]
MTKGTCAPRPWEQAFLAALGAGETQTDAARVAGIARTTAQKRQKVDARFAAEVALALQSPRKKSIGDAPRTISKDKKLEIFLARLAETSNVSAAAADAQLSTASVYDRRRDDPTFAQRWTDALAEGYDRLEMDLLERLRTGRLEDVDAEGKRRKFDVSAAFRCIAAHRETVAREKGRRKLSDEIVTIEAINARIDKMREKEEAALARNAAAKGVIVVRDEG